MHPALPSCSTCTCAHTAHLYQYKCTVRLPGCVLSPKPTTLLCPHAPMPPCPHAPLPPCPHAPMPTCPHAHMPPCPHAHMPTCPHSPPALGTWRHSQPEGDTRLAINTAPDPPHPAAPLYGLSGTAAQFVVVRYGRLELADGTPHRVAGLDVPQLMAWAAEPATRQLVGAGAAASSQGLPKLHRPP